MATKQQPTNERQFSTTTNDGDRYGAMGSSVMGYDDDGDGDRDDDDGATTMARGERRRRWHDNNNEA